MQKAVIQLETLTCPSCLQKIEKGILGVEGVDKERLIVIFNASRVKVTFDQQKTSIEEIEKVIENLGYEVFRSRVGVVA